MLSTLLAPCGRRSLLPVVAACHTPRATARSVTSPPLEPLRGQVLIVDAFSLEAARPECLVHGTDAQNAPWFYILSLTKVALPLLPLVAFPALRRLVHALHSRRCLRWDTQKLERRIDGTETVEVRRCADRTEKPRRAAAA